MDVKDYAKYTIDNIHRATLSNALNICTKLDTQGGYTFKDFTTCIYNYVLELLKNSKLDANKCYRILSATIECLEKYNSPIKYNHAFIIDDYIINIWRIINGS